MTADITQDFLYKDNSFINVLGLGLFNTVTWGIEGEAEGFYFKFESLVMEDHELYGMDFIDGPNVVLHSLSVWLEGVSFKNFIGIERAEIF